MQSPEGDHVSREGSAEGEGRFIAADKVEAMLFEQAQAHIAVVAKYKEQLSRLHDVPNASHENVKVHTAELLKQRNMLIRMHTMMGKTETNRS